MVHRLVDLLLAWAVRRWPVSLRDELSREWDAELHALGQEPGAGPMLRTWRQLRFAASLAVSRPHRVGTGWMGRARRWSPLVMQTAWLVLAPGLTALAAMAVRMLVVVIPVPITKPALVAVLAAESLVVGIGCAVWAGTLLGRRYLRRVGYPQGLAGYVWMALSLIGGLLLADAVARGSSGVWDGGWLTAMAGLCLALSLPPAAVGIAAVALRRPRLAAVVAAFAAPALTLTVVYLLVLLAPQPASAGGYWWWLEYISQQDLLNLFYDRTATDVPIEQSLSVLPMMILITAVIAVAQAIRLARPSTRPLPAVAAPQPCVPEPTPQLSHLAPAAARSPWWHRTALAAAGYCVLAWAVTLAYLTPNIGEQPSPPGMQSSVQLLPDATPAWPGWDTDGAWLWMQELQLSCIVCAAMCLLCAAAYRGRPLLPTLAGSVLLLSTDMIVVRAGWATPRILPWLAGGGLVLGALCWSAATRNPPDPQRPQRPRRLLITVTVMAAFLIPGSFTPRAYINPGVQAPPVLLAVAVGLPIILAFLVGVGILAASSRQRTAVRWWLPAGLTVPTAVGGILYYQDSLTGLDPEQSPSFLMLIGPSALALPLATWAIIAIRARPATIPRIGMRIALTTLLLAVGWQFTIAIVLIGGLFTRLLLFPMQYGQGADALPLVPGSVAAGLLLGYIAAHQIARPEPAPVAATDGDPVIDLGHPPPVEPA